MPVQSSNALLRTLLWLLLALAWFSTLGYRDLIHPDEGRYAEIAREMAQTGDFITPHLNGLKYFEKPALQYWLSAAAFKVFGEADWVARLCPGVSGFLLIVLLYFSAKKLWGQRSADFTALIAAGGIWLVGDSHYLTLDMSLGLFMSATLCGFILAFIPENSATQRRNWLLIAWAGMALAVLTKGLIGIILPGAVLVLYTLATRHWFIWKQINWISGIGLFLLIAAPWFIIVSKRNPEFAHFFFIHEHFERFTTTTHRRTGSWHYFIPILLAGLLPWTTLLLNGIRQGISEPNQTFRPKLFLLIWSIFIFAFFSLSSSKLPSYILPVFPALTLLLADYLNQAKPSVFKWHSLALGIFWILFSIAAFKISPHRGQLFDQQYLIWCGWVGLPLAAFAFIAAYFSKQDKIMLAVLTLSIASLTAGQALIQGHQVYSPDKSAKTWVEQIKDKVDPNAPFYSVGNYNQTLPFYLKRTLTLVNWVDEFALGIEQAPNKAIATEDEFFAVWQTQASAAAIMREGAFDDSRNKLGNVEELYRGNERVIFRKVP